MVIVNIPRDATAGWAEEGKCDIPPFLLAPHWRHQCQVRAEGYDMTKRIALLRAACSGISEKDGAIRNIFVWYKKLLWNWCQEAWLATLYSFTMWREPDNFGRLPPAAMFAMRPQIRLAAPLQTIAIYNLQQAVGWKSSALYSYKASCTSCISMVVVETFLVKWNPFLPSQNTLISSESVGRVERCVESCGV